MYGKRGIPVIVFRVGIGKYGSYIYGKFGGGYRVDIFLEKQSDFEYYADDWDGSVRFVDSVFRGVVLVCEIRGAGADTEDGDEDRGDGIR